jgi:hypothetical protein
MFDNRLIFGDNLLAQSFGAMKLDQVRTLLVLCTAFRAKRDRFQNLTIKKIPRAVLSRCEWGHDDYSLQVENLPRAPPEPGQQKLFGSDDDGNH